MNRNSVPGFILILFLVLALTGVAFATKPGSIALTGDRALASIVLAPVSTDLAVQITADPPSVYTGQVIQYTIIVTNNGPDNISRNVTVLTDPLQGKLIYQSASTSCSGTDTITCTLNPLSVGQTAQFTLNLVTTASAAPGVSNTVTVSAPGNKDPHPENDRATATTTVIPNADLGISLNDSPDPVYAGQNLRYTLNVINKGPNSAANVIVGQALPGNIQPSLGLPSECSLSSPGNVQCNFGGLAVGSADPRVITVKPGPSAAPIILTSSATVHSDTQDLTAANNSASASTALEASADLSIAFINMPASVHVGENLEYTIQVANVGPDTATGVLITQTLPPNIGSSVTAPGCDTGSQPGKVICPLNDLAANNSASVSVTVIPTASAPPSVSSSVQVESTILDSDPTNNTANNTTPVLASADLSVTLTDSPDPVHANQELVYTIQVSNAGPNTATGIVVDQNLPANVTQVNPPPSGCVYPTTSTVQCTFGDLATGASSSKPITVIPTNNAVSPLSSTATVNSVTYDPVSGNNSDAESTTLAPSADLSVQLTSDPNPVYAGQLLNYTIHVTNSGPNTTNVIADQILPINVTFVSSDAGCDHSGNTVHCQFGDIATNGTSSKVITVRPNANAVPSISSTAGVSSSTNLFDPNGDNNSSTNQTTVLASADLAISMSGQPATVVVGDLITYTATINNNIGPSPASVTFSDTLPPEVQLYGNIRTIPQVPCSTAGPITCTFNLSKGAQQKIEFTVTAKSSGDITNQGVISSATHDPVPVNNTAEINTAIYPKAGLSVSLEASPAPVYVGSSLAYTATVLNGGPSVATNVVLTQTLPAGLAPISVSPNTCTQPAGKVRCALGSIAPDAKKTVSVVVIPQSPGAVTSSVIVKSSAVDPKPDDNNRSVERNVLPAADLKITGGTLSEAYNGLKLTYTIQVSNQGPSPATNVVITDPLPQGVILPSVSSNTANCSVNAGTITCAAKTSLAKDDNIQITVEATVNTSLIGTLTNTVHVTSATADPDLNNNSHSISTNIIQVPAAKLPKVSWVEPATVNNIYDAKTRSVQIKVNATDDQGIAHVEFWRWDIFAEPYPAWVLICNVRSAPYQCSLPVSTLNFGSNYDSWNQVAARAYDTSNYSATTPIIWIVRLRSWLLFPLIRR